MQASKILMIGAAGLVAALLFAGAVVAAGPNGMGDNATGDRDQLQDGSCDGTGCQDRACDGDHAQLRERDCERTCTGAGDMLRERNCVQDRASGEGDQLRLRDGSCAN